MKGPSNFTRISMAVVGAFLLGLGVVGFNADGFHWRNALVAGAGLLMIVMVGYRWSERSTKRR